MRKLILYIAMSLDGYIAKPNDNLDFLSLVAQEGEDYGYAAFAETVDTVIMGRKTYDWVLQHAAYPHTNKQSYIVTRTPRAGQNGIVFYTGSLAELVANLKAAKTDKHIYCDGGAALANALLRENLIDELVISVVPVLLGEGIRLFDGNRPEQLLTLLTAKTFESGLVQLHYQRKG